MVGLLILALTPHTINVDADLSEWKPDELMEFVTTADNDADYDSAFYFTWDGSFIYAGVNATYGNNDYFLYIDVNPASGSIDVPVWGRELTAYGDSFPDGFRPDYVVAVWSDGTNSGHNFYWWNGTEWVDQTSSFDVDSSAVMSNTDATIEISVSRSLIGNPSSVKVAFYGDNKADKDPWKTWLVHPWANWEDLNTYPLLNANATSGDPGMAFKYSGFFEFYLDDGVSPSGARTPVDVSIADWQGASPLNGVANITVNSGYFGELIWKDYSGDERDPGLTSPSDLDIDEFGISAEKGFLTGYVKFSGNLSTENPVIVISIDTDRSSTDTDYGWSGDDAETFLAYNSSYWERDLMIAPKGGYRGIWVHAGGSWWKVRSGALVRYGLNSTSGFVEFRVGVWDLLGDSSSGLADMTLRMTAFVASWAGADPNSAEAIADFYGTGSDAIDVVSFLPASEELIDNDIDFYFDFVTNSTGSLDVAFYSPPALSKAEIYPSGTYYLSHPLQGFNLTADSFSFVDYLLYDGTSYSHRPYSFGINQTKLEDSWYPSDFSPGASVDVYLNVWNCLGFRKMISSNFSVSTTARKIDGDPADWINLPGSWRGLADVKTDATKGNEWVFADPLNDERTDGTDPDTNYDIDYVVLHSTSESIYFLVKLSDITSSGLPLISILIDNSTNFNSTQSTDFGAYADTRAVGDFSWAAVVSASGTQLYDVDSGWTPVDGIRSYISDASDVVEISIDRKTSAITGNTLRFALIVAENNSTVAREIGDASISDALDVMSINVGKSPSGSVYNTWGTAIGSGDSLIETVAVVPLDSSFEVSVDSSLPVNPDKINPSDGASNVPVSVNFQWNASSSSDADDQIVSFMVIGDDSSSFSATDSSLAAFYRGLQPWNLTGNWTNESPLDYGTTYSWEVWAINSRLLAYNTTSSYWRFTTSSPARVVDGDPDDWATGSSGANYTVMTLQKSGYKEWVYFGTAGDRRTDAGTTDDADLVELHLTCDAIYLYGLVKVADLQDDAGSKFHLSILLDTDLNPSDPKGNWIGDDGDTLVPFGFQFGERVIDVHGNGTDMVVELYDPDYGSSWWTPSDAVAVGDATYDAVEFRVPLSDLGISYTSFPKIVRITAVTFTNVAGWNNDNDTTLNLGTMDAVDVASGFPAYGYSVNSWDRDISDGKIDWSYTVRLSSGGAYALGPDGDYSEWIGTPSTGLDNATVSQNEWIWIDASDDSRKDIPDAQLDLKEVRIKGVVNYARDALGGQDYIFIRADVDSCSDPGKPLLLLGFSTGTISSPDKMYWFADDSATSISYNAPPLDFQVMVGLDGAWFFAADSSSWYRPEDVYYFIITDSASNSTRMEVAIPVSRLGYSSLSQMASDNPIVYIALGACAGDGSPDAIDKTRTVSYGTSDIIDLASFRASTWDEVEDHTVATWFRIPFVSGTTVSSFSEVQNMFNSPPNQPASLGPYGDVAEYPVALFAKWTGLPDPDSGDAVSFASVVVNGTHFYSESLRISYSGATYYVLAWDLTEGATYTPEKFVLRDDVGSKVVADYSGATFTVHRAYRRIDGLGEDWLSGSPEIPYTAYLDLSRNEWSYKDALGDSRSHASWADLWKVRFSVYKDSNPSTADYFYGLIVFYGDISLNDLLLVVAVDNGTGTLSPLPSDIDSETYLRYSSLMVVSSVGNPVFNSTDVIGAGVSYIASNVVEFRFPLDQIGLDGVAQFNLTVLLFERNTSFEARDYEGADVVDALNFYGSAPWQWEFSSTDSVFDNEFLFTLNPTSQTFTVSSSAPSVDNLTVSGEISGKVYAKYPVFQWDSSGTGTFVVEIYDNYTGESIFLASNTTSLDLSKGPLLLVPGRNYSFRVYPRDLHGRAGQVSGYHSFTLYSPAREVDGDPGDWFAPPPACEDTASLYAGEWFFLDERGDARTDSPSASTNFDITQLRITSDDAYVYFLVKFAFITSTALPYVSIALDVDPDSDSDGVWFGWIGDESSSTGSTPVNTTDFKPDYIIDVYSGGVYIYNGTSWWTSSSIKFSSSKENSCFEFAIPVSLLGLSLPSRVAMAVASAQHDTSVSGTPETTDTTRDFYLSDFLDVVSYNHLQKISAWDADLSDGVIDSHFSFNLTGDGVKDSLPVISNVFPPSGYRSPYLKVQFYWDDNDTDGYVLGRRLRLSTDVAFSSILYDNYTRQVVNSTQPMEVILSGGKTYFAMIEIWDTSYVRTSRRFAFYVKPVVGPEGGTLSCSLSPESYLEVSVSEGAFSDYVELVATQVNSSHPSSGDVEKADSSLPSFIESKPNPTVEFKFVLSTNSSVEINPSKPVLLRIFYPASYENVVSEQRLKMYRLDASSGKWVEIEGSRCVVRANYVEACVSGSGVYRVMEADSVSLKTLESVIVFPTLVEVGRGAASVKFDMLPEGAVVEIYSLDGRKIWTSQPADAFGRVIWNLKTDSGKDVEAGMVLYRIVYSSGDLRESRTGKIVVVK